MLQLLAKDGVYLPTAPRAVAALPIPSGGRADVAVCCATAGTFTFSSSTGHTSANLRRRQRRRALLGKTPMYEGTVFTFTVAAAADDDALAADDDDASAFGPSGVFAVARPCYLADVTGATVDGSSDLALTMDQSVKTYGNAAMMVNGEVYAEGRYLMNVSVGTLVDWRLEGLNEHPAHFHVNHFQLVDIDADDPTYFQVPNHL